MFVTQLAAHDRAHSSGQTPLESVHCRRRADIVILDWRFEALVLDGSVSFLYTINVNVYRSTEINYSQKNYTLKKLS